MESPGSATPQLERSLIASPRAHKAANDAPLRLLTSDEAGDEVATKAPMLPLILARLDEDQAENVVPIDLSSKSDIADAMVIASGRSQRHVGALADKILRDLKEAGYGTVPAEGLPACDWVLIDAGDVVVHLFRPEVRDFYRLERIWAPERFEPASSAAAADGPGAPATDAGEEPGVSH